MTAEDLRKVSGGVIGHFTPKEIVVDIAKDTALGAVGSNALGLKVPANKFVVGAYIKNVDNDLASGGSATVAVTVGDDASATLTATTLVNLKGKGACAIKTAPAFYQAEQEVKLTVATAGLTAGKLTVGIIYA